VDRGIGIKSPSVKEGKNWRRGSERIALSKESRKESKNAGEKPNEELLIYLCLTPLLAVLVRSQNKI